MTTYPASPAQIRAAIARGLPEREALRLAGDGRALSEACGRLPRPAPVEPPASLDEIAELLERMSRD